MKYFFSLITISFLILSCSNNDANMTLSGHVKGLKKGTLLLQKIEDTLLVSVDSVLVNGDSNFKFSEEITSPEMYYLYVRLKDGTLRDDRIPFFAEPGQLTINTTLKNFEVDARITGSRNEKALDKYRKLVLRYTSKNIDYIQENFEALKSGNDSLATAISLKQERLVASKYFMVVNFALNHNDYEMAPYLMLTEVSNTNIKYLDTVYGNLTPKIKDSKYGKALESFIVKRKKE